MNGGRLCWGLLSTARINERLIPVLRESKRSELKAIASRDRQAAQAYASRWQIPRAYGSYDELLADPDIQVVYVSLPNHLHAEWSVRCAEAGKHVLCEKPLALTVEEVDRMMAAAQQNGVIIQEATMMRFHPQTHQLREAVAQNVIGDVRLVRGVFTFVLRRPGDIRLDPTTGGGSLWDLGSYCVSFSRTILQAEPVEVFAFQSTGESGVDLSFSAQLRFASGTLVHFFSSFAAFPHVEADFLGTEGRLYLDLPWVNQPGKTAHVRLTRSHGGEKSTFGDGLQRQTADWKTYEATDGYRDEVESMAESILDRVDPVISLADSRNNVAAITALARSARECKPVTL